MAAPLLFPPAPGSCEAAAVLTKQLKTKDAGVNCVIIKRSCKKQLFTFCAHAVNQSHKIRPGGKTALPYLQK